MDEAQTRSLANASGLPPASDQPLAGQTGDPSPANSPALADGVVIVADIFRFEQGNGGAGIVWHQRRNAQWIHAIVRAMLAANAVINVELIDHEALGLETAFGPASSDCPDEWWRQAIGSPIKPDLASRIGNAVDGKVVVAFEVPEVMRAVMQGRARTILDVSLSPLRFVDDLLLDLASDDPVIVAALSGRAIDERRIAWNAAMLRARMGSLAAEERNLPANVVLLAAQTPRDRALLCDNGFLDLAYFADRITTVAAKYDLLLVRPHPHTPDDVGGLKALLTIPHMRITNANTYRLIASSKVRMLLAISSSLLAEGGYLGIDTIALANGPSTTDPIVHFALDTLTGPVAEAIATLCGADIAGYGSAPAHGSGVLRAIVGMDWSFGDAGRASDAIPALDLQTASSRMLAGSAPELTAALVFGWHPQENWGVWGSGPISTLSFGWPVCYCDATMFVLEVMALNYTGQFGDHIEIWAEGRLIETFVAPPPGSTAKIAFIVNRPQSMTSLQVHICCGAQRSIANDSANTDRRRLGIGLLSLAWFPG